MEKNSSQNWRKNNKIPGSDDLGFSLLLNQLGFDSNSKLYVKTTYENGMQLHLLHQREQKRSVKYQEADEAKKITNLSYLSKIYPDLFTPLIPATVLIISDPVMAYGISSVFAAAREQTIALYWPDKAYTEMNHYHEGNILASASQAAQALTGFSRVPFRRHLGPSVTQFYKAPQGCPDLSIQDRSMVYSWLTEKHDWVIIGGALLPEGHIPFGVNVKNVIVTKKNALKTESKSPEKVSNTATNKTQKNNSDEPITLQMRRSMMAMQMQDLNGQLKSEFTNSASSTATLTPANPKDLTSAGTLDYPLTLDGRPIATIEIPHQVKGDEDQLFSWICAANMICEDLLNVT